MQTHVTHLDLPLSGVGRSVGQDAPLESLDQNISLKPIDLNFGPIRLGKGQTDDKEPLAGQCFERLHKHFGNIMTQSWLVVGVFHGYRWWLLADLAAYIQNFLVYLPDPVDGPPVVVERGNFAKGLSRGEMK